MRGQIVLHQQECEENYSFEKARVVMTANFKHVFEDEAEAIIMSAILAIKEKYGNKADYMQVFDYNVDGQMTTFWLIYDEMADGQQDVVTALMPEDY